MSENNVRQTVKIFVRQNAKQNIRIDFRQNAKQNVRKKYVRQNFSQWGSVEESTVFLCGLLQGMACPTLSTNTHIYIYIHIYIHIYIYIYIERERDIHKHLVGGTEVSYFGWCGGVSPLIPKTLSDCAKDSSGRRHKSLGC